MCMGVKMHPGGASVEGGREGRKREEESGSSVAIPL
jgi:hypothetical protein